MRFDDECLWRRRLEMYETFKLRSRHPSLVWGESDPLRSGVRRRTDSVITYLMRGIARNGGSEEVSIVDPAFKLPQRSAFERYFPTLHQQDQVLRGHRYLALAVSTVNLR